jgi:2-polyprenyl-3-methyl-5-hydroxy-6-metoxy-1,4-benzoquinol methylase
MAKICRICKNATGNSSHRAREMMLGLRTTFDYLECTACGCLQLADLPENLGRYYPSNYYSFHDPKSARGTSTRAKQLFRKLRNRALLSGIPLIDRILGKLLPYPQLAAIGLMKPRRQLRILDVGCGSGNLLLDLRDAGFANVLGVDPFIERDIQHSNGVQIKKGFLSDLTGTTWDLIIFNHSFEHIWEEQDTLKVVRDLLSDGGQCLISIPVVAEPWKVYGTNWVELDAPRHVYLHTDKSMQMLARNVGLDISRVTYDSSEFQFWGSELFRRDISLAELGEEDLTRYFTHRQLDEFRRQSNKLNQQHQGGRATFYLTKPIHIS